MWVVEPEYLLRGDIRVPSPAIINLNTVVRAAHLIPVYSEQFIPADGTYSSTLDNYQKFYVNKYADHHAYEIAF